jgi:arginine transport system ATP-binding protein
VEFARKVASQVIYLEKGRIIESGTAAIFNPANQPVCRIH